MPIIQAQVWKSSAFSIERSKGNAHGTVIFRMVGPFTARDMYGALTPEALRTLFDASTEEPVTVQIFDLSGVPYMDSAGLGMIVSQHVRCLGKCARLILAGVSPRVLQLLKLTKVDTFIAMASTVEEAQAL